jgi:NAD kinase
MTVHQALNEITIQRQDNHMCSFDVYVNNDFLTSLQGDGYILKT